MVGQGKLETSYSIFPSHGILRKEAVRRNGAGVLAVRSATLGLVVSRAAVGESAVETSSFWSARKALERFLGFRVEESEMHLESVERLVMFLAALSASPARLFGRPLGKVLQ